MYGKSPRVVDQFSAIEITEFMHYQYLPVNIPGAMTYIIMQRFAVPERLQVLNPLVYAAVNDWVDNYYQHGDAEPYVYLTARHGFATPGNPLNRPGWHCDGFGTDDINYVWWDGPGTRFAEQSFGEISDDHFVSLKQFEARIWDHNIRTYGSKLLLRLDPYVVHSTPEIEPPGCMRSFVKISISKHRYNLIGNSHNYMLDYDWEMYPRDIMRNDPSKAGRDFY